MTAETMGDFGSREAVRLGAHDALEVTEGVVLLFAVSHGGSRRIPMGEVHAGEVAVGADLETADIVACGLPGTSVQRLGPPDPSQVAASRGLAIAALRREEQRAAAAADVLAAQAHHEQRVVDDALLSLVTAVPGTHRLPGGDWALPREAAIVEFLTQQIGLRPDPLRLRRAVTDAEVSGRDLIPALGEAAGASMRRVQLPPGWWQREGPALLVWQDGRSVATVWRGGSYHLWDPDEGLLAAVDSASAAGLASQATVFEPLLDASKPASVRDLLRLGVGGSRHSLLLVFVLTAVVGLLAAVIPIVSGALTQSVASQTTSTLLVVAAALTALALGDLLIRAVRSYALLRVRGRVVAISASAVWDRLLRLPMSWHARSSVTSRMTDANAVDIASMSVPNTAVTALLDISTVIGAIIGAFLASPALAIGLIGFLIVRALIEFRMIRRSAQLTREVVDATARSQSLVLQLVRGVNQLRVAGATGRAFALWATSQAEATGTQVRQRRLGVVQQMTGAVWPTLGLAVLFTITALVGADVGQLVTAQTALTASTSALAAAVAAIGAILSARAVIQRAGEVLRSRPESGTGQEIAKLTGTVDMRDVVFRYRDDMPAVLDSLSLSIPAGSHCAIVGPSGCGKSTVLRLLLGLDDPESGIVSYDGRDLSGLDRAAVRRQTGTVMQASQLLPGTIRENVDLGRGLTLDEIWEALEQASVADDIRSMPMQLATLVVEGASTISGGQRQRILLARALAGKPQILVLDEATSALDNVSQAAIVANLDRLEITRIVVAHRLSTIERADQIVVLGDGKVIQQGTFSELMRTAGPFSELVKRQQI